MRNNLGLALLLAGAFAIAPPYARGDDRQDRQSDLALQESAELRHELDGSSLDSGCRVLFDGAIGPYLQARIGQVSQGVGLKGYSAAPLALAVYLASGCPPDFIRTFWPKVEIAALAIDRLGAQ